MKAIKSASRLVFENDKGAIYVDPSTFKVTDKAGSVPGFSVGSTTSKEALAKAGYTESRSTKPFVSSAQINQHRGKANNALYYTPEQIEALQPDEHGRPTRSWEDAGWDPGTPIGLDTNEMSDFSEESFDLTNPAMRLFLQDLNNYLSSGDYKSAIEALHDMGYSSDDAYDLVEDFKTGLTTPEQLFSRVKLFGFLQSASQIKLNQNADSLQVYADHVDSRKVLISAVSFTTKSAPLTALNKIESCLNLNRGVEAVLSAGTPDFREVVKLLSQKNVQFSFKKVASSFSHLKSSVSSGKPSDFLNSFGLPKEQAPLYSKVVSRTINL